MNKLAFFGVTILGLVLLVTHLVVTLIIAVGPRFVISKPVRTECEWIFSKRTKGTIKFPTWLTIYGLIGSLLIICGTAFMAIGLLKGLKMKEYKGVLDSVSLGNNNINCQEKIGM